MYYTSKMGFDDFMKFVIKLQKFLSNIIIFIVL
jgi:hypothetical protein